MAVMKYKKSFLLFTLCLFIGLLKVTSQTIWPTKNWTSASPKDLGLNPDTLALLDASLANGSNGYMDGLLIIRHGKIAWQRTYKHDYAQFYKEQVNHKSGLNPNDPSGPYNYFNDWWHPWYHSTNLHTLQSVTKTVTSVIIGVAIARKEFPDINTPVLHFFDTSQIKFIDDHKRRMTIKHLLTMTAGFSWDENVHYDNPNNDCSVMEAGFDWVGYVINKPMSEAPGTKFNYNSGATELLAYIFRVATGKDIERYAVEHLFKPLGIESHFWKRIPTGLVDTEGGLYLSPADLAKIFYLFLHNGEWEGKQIVTRDWVKQSVTPQISIGGNMQYGYKWWLQTIGMNPVVDIWRGSGFGGQLPIVIPAYDMVVVFNAWNILEGKPGMHFQETMRMILNAVEKDKK
jgi:CubicO group peptidase (beta-lactamase class C family)